MLLVHGSQDSVNGDVIEEGKVAGIDRRERVTEEPCLHLLNFKNTDARVLIVALTEPLVKVVDAFVAMPTSATKLAYRKSERGREAAKRYNTSPRGKLNNRLRTYKCNAKIQNRIWALTKEEAIKLLHSSCAYCGQLPDPVGGIDRIDNNKGYTRDNTLPCCSFCNRAKHIMPKEAFEEKLMQIAKFWMNK